MPGALAAESYPQGPRPGRPRDPRVDAAIRTATLALLVEEGYQGTSIQAIARRARVSAPSIYRRWSSKAELVEEVVFPSIVLEPDGGGDLAEELQTYCRRILDYLADPAIRAAIPGLLTEYQTDPRMWQRLVDRSLTPMRTAFTAFLARSGRAPVGSADALFEVLLGALFVRAVNTGTDGADQFAREVALVATAALAPGEADRPRGRRR